MKYLCILLCLQSFAKIIAGNILSLPAAETSVIARKRIRTLVELPDRANRNELSEKVKRLNTKLEFATWGTVPYHYFTYDKKQHTAYYVKIDEQPITAHSDVFEFVGGDLSCVQSKVSEIIAKRIQQMHSN